MVWQLDVSTAGNWRVPALPLLGQAVTNDSQGQTAGRAPGTTPSARPLTSQDAAAGGPPPLDGRRRVVIEAVEPSVDGGRFPIKRIVGDRLEISADVFADGHDVVLAALRSRYAPDGAWLETPMQPLGNDRWRAELTLDRVGRCEYTIVGWVDAFESWRRDLAKRREAGQDLRSELQIGAALVADAARRAPAAAAARLSHWQTLLTSAAAQASIDSPGAEELWSLMARYPDREHAAMLPAPLTAIVDRQRAQFSAWYELFPRSCASEPGRHGTFADCAARLPYVAAMGFDVLYLAPIHPIGSAFRKGRNNQPQAQPGDPGSPWGIGSAEGGHKAVHPALGTLDDFQRLLGAARQHGLEVALDVAYQCSPDHPYVKEHPEWFRHRPDGTIQYAENPPKKYQDIYPFDFETPAWRELWAELKSIVEFWCEQGVRIFRVDNPHTKPLAFWEWMIADVKRRWPETVFLSEAFTRPKVMYQLAKLGFTQSYTYFTWRNSKAEFIDYLTELTKTEVAQFFRPNFWTNTPDILPDHLQQGGRAAAIARLVLASTLSASYGVYGPAFELCEAVPREPGSEEYADSEKYEVRCWDLDRPESIAPLVARLNQARRDNAALQSNGSLRFVPIENDRVLAYTKGSLAEGSLVLVVVNLDFRAEQGGFLELPLAELGIDAARPYLLHDALSMTHFTWQGSRNFVLLAPQNMPAHVFVVRQASV